MALLVRIGEVECPNGACDYHNTQHVIHVERPETQVCPKCGADLIQLSRKNSIAVPGRYANDISSELYVRPDANCAFRENMKFAHETEKLVEAGVLEDIDDAAETRAALKCYAENQDYFGSIDKPTKIEVSTDNTQQSEKDMFKGEPSMDDLLGRITELTPSEMRNKRIGALND